ncbi:DUF4240 domain-containing protein [Streptomyces sp. NBC_01235]|uniref:DUF4240 domain-containing protein n=1 Tax=Streptomyces sp. NBC_01235 TaxID=2903788 RepID=UPI002E0DDBF3|nr:DUF4240 domain-containing protein [Streptomyces sp. NBC_01235]
MNTDEFWDAIETARARTTNNLPFNEALTNVLAHHSVADILAYRVRFDVLHDALYRWDIWAAAYLIGGGCSDDSFIDFRAGVIAQGRAWYDRVTADPDSLADHPEVVTAAADSADDALFDEDVTYAPGDAYERLTGDEDGFYDALREHEAARPGTVKPDMGEDFDFDDEQEMRGRLPRLAALFLGEGDW